MLLTLLKFISVIIKTLKSTSNPTNIALRFSVGFVFGMPPFNWIGFLITLCIFTVFDIGIAAGFLGIAIGTTLSFITTPIADVIGTLLLSTATEASSLYYFFSLSLSQLLELNYSIVLGQTLIGLFLFIPVFFGARSFILYYRKSLHDKLVNHPLFKVLSLSKFGRWFIAIYSKVQ